MKNTFYMNISRSLLLFAVFYLSLHQLFGQTAKVTGVVFDEESLSVPFASISFLKSGDTLATKHTLSDLEGNFTVTVPFEKYTIRVQSVGYDVYEMFNYSINEETIDLGKITLKSKVEELNEVLIEVEKEQFSLQLDKRVFNVSENTLNAGGTATEVLESIPSVDVDVDGQVSLRGSENVRILIDGKPSGMVGSDFSKLGMIQADMIEKVEIITNPSSRYDAEGDAGIINIVLKKEKQNGLNGSFDLMTGFPDNHKASFNLNYRSKSVNLFSSYGINYRKSPGWSYSEQNFELEDTSFSYIKDNESARGGLGQNLRLGSDFFLNKYNTITFTGGFSNSNGDNFSNNTYDDYNSSQQLINTSERIDNEQESKEVWQGEVHYEKTFEQKKRKLTAELQFYESDDLESSNITQDFSYAPDSTLKQLSDNTENEQNFLFQSDYVHPIGKQGSFETGIKGNLRTIENNFAVEQDNGDGVLTTLPAYNNDFRYDENIYAAYAQYGNKKKNFTYQLGVRGEYSDITTELLKTNEVNRRKYFNLFPSLFLGKELDSLSTLQFSYSRRISRPRFRHLLPFYSYNDNRNLFTGNPDLNPVYAHSIELSYLRYIPKGSFLPSIYYRYSAGDIQRITLSDSSGITQTLPINLADHHAIGVELALNYNPYKWWSINGGLNSFYSIVKGEYEGESYDRTTFRTQIKLSSKIELNKKTSLQNQFRYRSPMLTTQGSNKSVFTMDIAISREVLNKKGLLVFSVKDILNSNVRRSIVETDTYYLETERQRRQRQFTLAFSYFLKAPKKGKGGKGKGKSGNDDLIDDDF